MASNVTPHNPTIPAGLTTFTYEVKSAAVSGTTATVVFRINADGTPVTLNAAAAGGSASLTGYTGGPSFLLAYALDQEGVSPVDYNNLGLANGQPKTVSIADLRDTNKALTVGTLSAPDASGYYTATILSAFPADAKLRSVGLQGYFTQVSPAGARHAISVVKAVTGDTVRRKVIDSAKCAKCHEWFEGHGGNRVYEVQLCVQCHVPGMTTSGRGATDAYMNGLDPASATYATLTSWGVDPTVANAALALPQLTNNFKDMIHGIHAGKDRTEPFRDARDFRNALTLVDAGKIGFPGILNNCQSCHTYNGYDGVPAKTLASRQEADNGVFLNGTNRTPADAKAALATINDDDMMTTPFTASCVSCHDSSAAKAHMTLNGGQVLVKRTTLNSAAESCAVCHGASAEFAPSKVH
ncbi:MAG TPA: hypothetical protein DHV93_08970 [Holophagaceae bacterium]|nr:hypothetical protein [Holophagaceae bacterium]